MRLVIQFTKEVASMGGYVQQFYIKPSFKSFIYIIIFTGLFFCFGVLGTQIQSAQDGIYLFWPASGLTLAAFYILGFWLWPGVLLGLALLALYIDIPLLVSLPFGIITVFESVIFLSIASKFNFKGNLSSFKDCLIFSILTLMVPVLTAILGALTMSFLANGQAIHTIDMILLWWLGNSLGILLLGGTLLSFYAARLKIKFKYRLNEKIALLLSVMFIFFMVFSQNYALDAALIVNFIIPILFFSALRFGACGTAFLGLLFVVLLSIFSGYSQHMMLEKNHFDFQYLILAKIWFVSISGILIAGAFNDSVQQGKLEWQALHDGLTGLFNRIAMEDEIESAIRGARLSDSEMCLLFLDVDHFKPINDQLGHKKGDDLLIEIAKVLKSSVRNLDVVARWGGDEFIILLHNCSEQQALHVSQKILKEIKALSFSENNQNYPLSMSIGVASIILGESKLSFIERADAATYEAKRMGKNQAVIA